MNTRAHSVLSQPGGNPLLTDGGLETDLIFNRDIDLPNFASFDLLSTERGRETLRDYFRRYLEIARRFDTGFILETPTWRASRDWGDRMGYSPDAIAAVNGEAVALLRALCEEYADVNPVLVSGNIGPRGDGYVVEQMMTADAARDYHAHQVTALAGSGADLVSAFTLNYIEEALGIALAAREAGIPVVLSFTVETDGRLPSGCSLREALEQVDAATGGYPLYYMINCAHPTHFREVLDEGGDWLERIGGVRGNASRCSHAELDAAETLDDGDPVEFGEDYRRLLDILPRLRVLGGCCGTDHRHVEQVAAACLH